MVIISQGKKELINFDNIQGIKIINNTVLRVLFVTGLEDDYTDIGAYKTEERAKRTMKEIIQCYKYYQGKRYTIGDSNELLGEYEYGVYEMPEE